MCLSHTVVVSISISSLDREYKLYYLYYYLFRSGKNRVMGNREVVIKRVGIEWGQWGYGDALMLKFYI